MVAHRRTLGHNKQGSTLDSPGLGPPSRTPEAGTDRGDSAEGLASARSRSMCRSRCGVIASVPCVGSPGGGPKTSSSDSNSRAPVVALLPWPPLFLGPTARVSVPRPRSAVAAPFCFLSCLRLAAVLRDVDLGSGSANPPLQRPLSVGSDRFAIATDAGAAASAARCGDREVRFSPQLERIERRQLPPAGVLAAAITSSEILSCIIGGSCPGPTCG